METLVFIRLCLFLFYFISIIHQVKSSFQISLPLSSEHIRVVISFWRIAENNVSQAAHVVDGWYLKTCCPELDESSSWYKGWHQISHIDVVGILPIQHKNNIELLKGNF